MAPRDPVEVWSPEGPRAWHDAEVLGVTPEGLVQVAFDGEAWPGTEVSPGHVRRPVAAPRDFDPQAGHVVEAQIPASEDAPAAWYEARVKIRDRNICVVSVPLPGFYRPRERFIPVDKLRPALETEEPEEVIAEIFELGDKLLSWTTTPDASVTLCRVEEQSGLVLLQPAPGKALLWLVGTRGAVEHARELLEPIKAQQLHELVFEGLRERRARKLERRANPNSVAKSPEKDGNVREFKTDSRRVGLIIGKDGANIKAMQKKHGVQISIADGPGADQRTVRVSAKSADAVEQAVRDTEVVEETMPVLREMSGWVVGRNFKFINEFRESAGLNNLRYDRDRSVLVFQGTRNACEAATMLYE